MAFRPEGRWPCFPSVLTKSFAYLHSRSVALSNCRKEISDTAWNCPHCDWHKSRTGLVAAWVVAIVIITLGAVIYYQIDQANKAEAALRKELDKSDRMIKALKPKSLCYT